MPLQYRDIYDRWQRSKSFGDPRDISTFAQDQNEVNGNNEFDAAVKPSWWKQASTAADVNFFEPTAKYSGLEAAGRGIGGLFGGRGAEIGERVGRSLPRTIAQTAPLIAADFLTGGAAIPVTAGALATGGLFGAQTYAETGDPTAAAISGVTAAALPAVGKIGGELGLRAFGPEIESGLTKAGQKFTLPVKQTALAGTEAGTEAADVTPYGRFKAARLAGSQAAQIGTLEASSAVQAKRAGQPFDPLSPEFLAQQIPFTLLDIAHTARAKVPTSDQVKVSTVLPQTKDYIPPQPSTPDAAASSANLADMLDQMTVTAKDQTITPEEKQKMFEELLGTVMNPEKTTATPTSNKVIITGHPKSYENSSKVYVTDAQGYNVPEHKNLWINDAPDTIQKINPDGSVTFVVDKKNISTNVKYPSGPMDFPALRSQQGEPLAPATPVAPGEGIAPATDLLSLRQKYQQLVNNDQLFQGAVANEPKDPDAAITYWQRGIDAVTPAHLKPGFVSPFDSGQTKVIEESGVDPNQLLFEKPPETKYTGPTQPVSNGVYNLEGKDFALGNSFPQGNGVALKLADGRYLSVAGRSYHGELVTALDHLKISDQDIVDSGFVKNGQFQSGGDLAENLVPAKQEMATETNPEYWWRSKIGALARENEQHKAVVDAVAKIETATQQISDSQQALNLVPQTSEDVTGIVAGQEDKLKAATEAGATPTQAVESVRQQTHVPVIDAGKQQVNLAQEELRQVANPAVEPLAPVPPTAPDLGAAVRGAQPPEGRGGFLKDKMGKVFTFVNAEQAQSVLDAYQTSRPDDQFAYRVALVRGKYKIRGAPKEVSLEGKPGTSLENVVATPDLAEEPVVDVENIKDQILQEAATTPISATEEQGAQEAEVFTPKAEDRPDASFTDYLNQLDMASKNPVILRNAAGFEDLPTAITAIQQFRTAITDVFSKGKTSFKDVNDALKAKGILRFDSEKEMKDTFRKMRSGMEEFTGKYRSFTLDSTVPHDQALTDEIGIQYPTQGLSNFLDWYIKNNPGSLIGDLATGLRKFSDFAHVNVTNDEGKGFYWRPHPYTEEPEINIPRLPSDREDALNAWGTGVLHELSHDTLADIDTRTDPAAIEFKAKMQRILKTLRESKQIPQEVRAAIKKSLNEGWYDKGGEHYKEQYDKALPGRDSWQNVHYSLQNERELIAGIFDSPELVRIMRETTMPKTPMTALNFFAQAFSRLFGYTPQAETAFGQLLSSYDNYLSGTRNSRGYNGVSYIRDSLVASGVNPGQMASRIQGITDLYNTGDIASSISSWERERDAGELPATTVAGDINPDLKTQLISGDPKSVGVAGDNLLADELPQHRELWLRAKEDLRIAKNLYAEVKKGNIYGEFSLFQSGLDNQGAKLNALKNALDKQDKALGRWVSLDALGNNDGISRLWGQTLKGQPVSEPLDQSGNEDIARQALGLENPSAEYISSRRREIAATGAKPMSWLDRMFKFSSFTSEEQPGFKPIYDTTHESQADAFRRMTQLNMVKNSGDGGGWNKEIANANKRVFQTPGLDRIASDILRRGNILDKMGETFSFDDPEVKEALARASTAKNRNGRSDRDDVITAINSEHSRTDHWINQVVPEHLTRMNRILTAGSIIGREIGMPYTKAWDLAGQMYTALGQLRDPAQAPVGAEALRAIAQQMQPDTFTKVIGATQGFINDSERHLAVLQKFPNNVSEQRYGDYHLVMSREGVPLRESYNTEKAARLRSKELSADGWTLEDIIPKNRTNVANIYGSDPVVSSMLELDQQALNRFESLIADLPLEKQQQLRPLIERAADYTGSQAAFTPIPTQASPRRRFVPGRETIDMIDNAEQYYRRSVNWMRHRETRAQTAFQMLDPEMLGNRPLREYATQFVDNNLAPDNPVARRLAEATFYWNLAGNLGVDFLHSIQSLTTGMASVIAETGSTTDAYKYVAGASGKVFKRYTTGKWSDPATERFVNWLTARGGLGLPAWGDIFDPTTMNYFQQYGPESTYGKTLNAIKAGVRGYKGIFLRHNDMVGALSGFQIGLDRGMSFEDAARFGEGVKDRGFYSAGKAQRSVGLWNMKEKAVPQLFSALRTYTLGWFSQLAHNYKVGFQGAPGDFSPAQIRGAKQAFAYMLGTQAVLAGALGLPGVGQGLGLLKQTTGLDLKGWTRKNLAAMFGEDQDDYGGLMTGMALHGLVSQFAPFDPSGRHIPNFPFTGVTPSKGFDLSSLIPAPFTTAADIITGLGAAAKGGDISRALPPAAQGAVHLLQGGGDIRNSKGELLYQLSPSERVVTALGLTPSRVAAAKETASTVSELNKAAAAQKEGEIGEVATLYRRGDIVNAQKRLAEIQQKNPTYDMASFVKAVSGAVEKQTMPFDWKREVNPALDIAGLQNNQPSRELERLQLRHGVAADLGLYERPSLRANIRASSVDDLMNADPYATRSAALQRLLTARQLRSRNISLTPEASQSPYQGFDYQP